MVAIMGPSGSGKTSLLNMISRRDYLYKDSRVEGTVSVNERELGPGDFGKLCAFVQQDDVLVETLSPKELLTFAAKMKTKINNDAVEIVVERILCRLGLQDCKNTMVGGFMRKGLSGGERKRTSIGYEMITEPKLLMLDEPTSGLDSHTSKLLI